MIGVKACALLVIATSAVAEPSPPVSEPSPPVTEPAAPDRSAIAQAKEKNLEHLRDGFRIALVGGGGRQVGFDIAKATGTGFLSALRVGTAAGPRLGWTADFVIVGFQQSGDGDGRELTRTHYTTVGPQLHLAEAVWVRGGVGAAYFHRQVADIDESRYWGVSGTATAAFDVVRRGRFALSLELTLLAAWLPQNGQVASSSFALGFAYY